MPIVTIQFTKEDTTLEQKQALIKGVTDLVENVLHRPRNLTFVLLNEVDAEDWGVGGLTSDQFRRQYHQEKSSHP